MRVRDEIKLATMPIYVVLLVFVVGGTAILARMAPALDSVLSENVVSVQASVDMLAAIATHETETHDTQRDFREALERARANVTIDGEGELIRRIESSMDATFAGDPAAKASTIDALLELERLNVSSMEHASGEARNLGSAGNAAVVMLASIALLVSLRGRRRLYRSILNAVVELEATMRKAIEDRDSMRRVSATDCATELAYVANGVNRLLDERTRRRHDEVGLSTIEKAALNRLLDRQERPTMLISRGGELLAASAEVLATIHPDRLAEVIDATTAAREAHVAAPSFPAWVSSEAIGEVGWLLAFREAKLPGPDSTATPHGASEDAVAGSDSASHGGATAGEVDAPIPSSGRPRSIPHTIGHGPLVDEDDHDHDHDEEHTGVSVRPGSSLFTR